MTSEQHGVNGSSNVYLWEEIDGVFRCFKILSGISKVLYMWYICSQYSQMMCPYLQWMDVDITQLWVKQTALKDTNGSTLEVISPW